MKNLSDKFADTIKTHFIVNAFFSQILTVYEICGKKNCTAGQAADDSVLRRMRIACCITKATGTHSEYVIVTACPRQLSLRERTSLLRSNHLACLI